MRFSEKKLSVWCRRTSYFVEKERVHIVVEFDIFFPLLTRCWYPAFKVLQELLSNDLQQSVGHGAAAAVLRPRRDHPPGVCRASWAGNASSRASSCLDAGDLQIQLAVRACGEGR